MQHQPVDRDLHRRRALVAPGDRHDRGDQGAEDQVPVGDEGIRDGDHHQRGRRQFGAEAGNTLLNSGITNSIITEITSPATTTTAVG